MSDFIVPVENTPRYWALAFVDAGFRVEPLPKGQKTPPPNGYGVRRRDRNDVFHHFTENPDDNIALVAGGDLVILDPDTKHGKPGVSQLEAIWEAFSGEGSRPDTLIQRTPTGGEHWVFRLPAGARPTSSNRFFKSRGADVDVRGAVSSYIVGAGSVVPDGGYEIINNVEPMMAPDWLLEELAREPEGQVAQSEPVAKMANIDPEHDALAKQELNEIFALVDRLTAAPDGQHIEIFGAERGWEHNGGFFTLACKAIEVARWPYTSVTVDQVQQVWAQRVPAKYARHDWESALASADNTWRWGNDQISGDILFGRPTPAVGADSTEASRRPSIFDQPIGFAAFTLFGGKEKDGETEEGKGLKVDLARRAIIRESALAIDNTGSVWSYDEGVYRLDDSVVLKRLYHLLGDRYSKSHLANVRDAIRATAPSLDLTRAPNPDVMNFRNGLLSWKSSDEVFEHSDETLTTTQFPYDWNPAATCPRFEHWLGKMLEPDQIELAWKVLGYMMLSGNPLQVAFMLYGRGSNGKSTFAHVIERLVGHDNVSAVPLKDFNARFMTSAMIGKVANIVGDIDADYQVSTAALKQITGSDALQFERKNRDAFRATLWATCLFSANKIPGTNDGSEGYAERWVPIHFKRKASEARIEGFSEELLWAEIEGIAYKAVCMLRRIPIERGSDRSAAFDLSAASSQEAVEEFKEASNSYYAWVKNNTTEYDGADLLKPKDLWAMYRAQTGVRTGGTNAPTAFREVLAARYGECKPRRGLYLGVQGVHRAYQVRVLDDGETAVVDSEFFDIVTQS